MDNVTNSAANISSKNSGKRCVLAGLGVMLSVFASSVGMASLFSHTSDSKNQLVKTEIAQSQSGQTQQIVNGMKSPVMSLQKFDQMGLVHQQALAKIFDLKVKEYRQYLYYMNNTIDGYEYQLSMNPNIELAMHTQDQQQYRHYLDNAIREDHGSISRMLRVTRDFPNEAKRIYPDELPIMTQQMIEHSQKGLISGDVAQLYCDIKSPSCANLLNVIAPQVRYTEGTKLDLFVVGKVSKSQLRAFAKSSISIAAMKTGRVTLNMGNEAFEKQQANTKAKLKLPFLIVRRDGVEVPLNLGSK